MKILDDIPIFGDITWRGVCATETAEQVTFVNWIRETHPSLGRVMLHPKNEGKRYNYQAARDKAMGLSPGAPDIIIPVGRKAFCCELKRLDHTKSQLQATQREWLYNAQAQGAYCCIALGHNAAQEAFSYWFSKYYEMN